MDFKEFLPMQNEDEKDELVEVENPEKIGPTQFYDIITSKKPDWQAIIYDLIHTEQLDPWDIDLVVLTDRYFKKILELEESDFYVSSKVLLAAALLLRIKSEFLLNKHIRSIDEILFGKKEEKRSIMERIEIEEDDLPVLIPKTPLPRSRRVTLQELMGALSKAINTESRRIKREVEIKRAKKLSEVDFPTFRKIDLKDRIKQFYAKILTSLKKKPSIYDKDLNRVSYSNLVGQEKEERLSCFLPLLHLSNTQKLWLEQEGHLQEIWVYLYEYFNKNQDKFVEELEKDIEEMKEELSEDYEGEDIGLEVEVEESARGIISEIKKEIDEIKRDKEIEEVSGFSDE